MADHNETPLQTAFTVSIEAREGVSTGISAQDRSHTIQVAIDPTKASGDLVQPGHVFPLRARDGGVLRRAGQTEAAVDLSRLAGLNPAGVVCEVMKDDGTMARVPDLVEFCERHSLKMITVADLIEHRRRTEKLVERTTTVQLPTAYGEFTAVAYREKLTGKHHVALVRGEVEGAESVLVRVHSECLTGDVFHSLRCDCGEQLEQALVRLAEEDCGVLLYMTQEGRGIGLLNKLKAYELQESGLDTVEANLELGLPADAREYGIGNQILADLGLTTIRILTNNPKKLTGIEGFGLTVVEQLPIETDPTDENRRYLKTKRDKLGHRLHHQDLRFDADRRMTRPRRRAGTWFRPCPRSRWTGERAVRRACRAAEAGRASALPSATPCSRGRSTAGARSASSSASSTRRSPTRCSSGRSPSSTRSESLATR